MPNDCPSDCAPVLVIYQGDDVTQLMQVLSNQLPVDLTSVLEMSITLANDPSAPTATVVATKTNSKIVVVSATLGTFNLVLSSTDTALLLVKTAADIDVVVTSSAGKKSTYRVPNGLTVRARAT